MQRFALEALDVSKRYGNRDALCRVNLVAEFGRVHGLLGPNGAGKTTLMRILLGLVRRDNGTVRLLGRGFNAITESVPEAVAGFVETPAFYPYLSGRRNLTLLARLDGLEKAGCAHKVSDCLEGTGLAMHADVPVGAYSAGMRQRLGVAAALLRTPKLLFLDEPTSSLDPAGARDVRAIARQLADNGAAVVLSSHDMAEVEELCETLTVLNRGRVMFAGTRGRAAQARSSSCARAPHQRRRRRARPGRCTPRRACRGITRWRPRGDGELRCTRYLRYRARPCRHCRAHAGAACTNPSSRCSSN